MEIVINIIGCTVLWIVIGYNWINLCEKVIKNKILEILLNLIGSFCWGYFLGTLLTKIILT